MAEHGTSNATAGTLAKAGDRRTLSLVIPVYFNAESLPDVAKAVAWFEPELAKRNVTLELLFVDDGSGDNSLAEMFKIKQARPATKIIKLTRNFGARYRYTGAALTTDFAWLIGAAFAPLVALWLCANFGLAYLGAYLLSGAISTLVALLVHQRLKRAAGNA